MDPHIDNKVYLGKYTENSPTWWVNFINQSNIKFPTSIKEFEDDVNAELVEFNAKLYYESIPMVEFKSRNDLINMILKWS